MLPSRSICTCTSCVDVLAVEPPAALRVLAQPDASAAAAARITRAEILGMRVLLVGDLDQAIAGPKKRRPVASALGFAGRASSRSSALEKFLHLVEPALRARIVTPAVLLAERFELAQQLALARSELHRRLDDDVAEEIARLLAAHALDPLAAHAEGFAGLGFGGHADLGGAVERGDRDLAAEGSGRDGDRHLAMQVVMVALEY